MIHDCHCCCSHHEYCRLHFGYIDNTSSSLLTQSRVQRWHNSLLSTLLAYVYVPEVSQLLKLLSQVGLFLSLHQQTLLHIAASKNYEHTVECLVDEGADINIKDNTGVGAILYTAVGTIFFFNQMAQLLFFSLFVLVQLLFEGSVYFIGKLANSNDS